MPGCEICAKANAIRQPFPKIARHIASRPLFRIHSDICRPLPTGYKSFKYFILFVDDFGRYISVGLLKARSEGGEKLENFINAAEKRLNQKTAVLRVDNAPELVEGKTREFCERKGITYEKTVPDASQQNGVAERANRTIATMARALLTDGRASNFFWPLAVLAAVHIKNLVPHRSLPDGVTPHERWFGEKPNLSHLRPFGCKVTCRKTDSDFLNKVEQRGENGIFMGYAPNAKGYLIWFPDIRTLKTRRDVIFHEVPEALTHVGDPDGDSSLWKQITGEMGSADESVIPSLSDGIPQSVRTTQGSQGEDRSALPRQRYCDRVNAHMTDPVPIRSICTTRDTRDQNVLMACESRHDR